MADLSSSPESNRGPALPVRGAVAVALSVLVNAVLVVAVGVLIYWGDGR